MATSKLRPAEGNHREVRPGLLRECSPGKGKLVLCRLRLLAHLDEDPRAEALLLDLVEQALQPPPVLRSPARVVVPRGREADWPWTAFGGGGGDGPVVAAEITPELEKLAKREPGLLLVTPEGSFFLGQGRRVRGPGTADRSEFAQFVTARGIRLVSDQLWR